MFMGKASDEKDPEVHLAERFASLQRQIHVSIQGIKI